MKYVAIYRPKAEREYWDVPAPISQTVYCEEDGPVETGLFDANGVKLYRIKDKVPVGFSK